MRSATLRPAAPVTFLLALAACAPAHMTNAEAIEALEQAGQSSRGEAATQGPIEVSTDFTIGAALESAAQQIAAWWQSQQACTTVTVTGATTRIDFGELGDDCVFQGRTYSGVAEITVASTLALQLEVTHDWYALSNGDVAVDGGAVVHWDGTDGSYHVTTAHTWTGLDDGRVVDVEGEHTVGLLDPSKRLLGGFTLEGTRDWTEDERAWQLDMVDLEVRLQDPVPQAGTFLVTNPAGKELDITFERVDERIIQATLTGTYKPLVFHINQLGVAVEVE